jgi:hypothetical protein
MDTSSSGCDGCSEQVRCKPVNIDGVVSVRSKYFGMYRRVERWYVAEEEVSVPMKEECL